MVHTFTGSRVHRFTGSWVVSQKMKGPGSCARNARSRENFALSHSLATCAVTELGVIRVCAQLPGGPWPPETTADRLLLTQVQAERSQKVGELLRVPAVLMMSRDRCATRSVILGVVLAFSESSSPLLAWISMASPRPLGDDLGHVASHRSSSTTS